MPTTGVHGFLLNEGLRAQTRTFTERNAETWTPATRRASWLVRVEGGEESKRPEPGRGVPAGGGRSGGPA